MRYAKKATEFYYSVSPFNKKTSRRSQKQKIQKILKKYRELRPREVSKYASIGLELSRLYLRELSKSKIIEKRLEGRKVYYSLK